LVDRNFPTENQDNVVSLAAFQPVKDGVEKVCSFKPSSASTNPIIERGKAALSRLEHDKQTWADWSDACKAQLEVQTLAMASARVNAPQGPAYRKAIKHYLGCYGFDRVNKSTRSLMCEVARNLAAIESWRSTLPNDELLELNHPRIVLAHWKRSLRSPPKPKGAKANPMLEGWNRANSKQRTSGLTEIRFDCFRLFMPADWHKPMKECAASLLTEDPDRNPDFRITRAVQQALNHIEIAGDPKTHRAVAQGHEKEALDELRAAVKALHAIKRRVRDLSVEITNSKANGRSS